MKFLIFGMFFFVVLLIGFFSYFFYYNPFKISEFIEIENDNTDLINKSYLEVNIDSYPEGMLFYENIRFPEKMITYSIDKSCSDNRTNDARNAFNILNQENVLLFNEVQEYGQIFVICSGNFKEISKEHFIAGEGGPSNLINAINYHIILNGTIFLYTDNECFQPVVAIHEILHVLGFKHSSDVNSIMYNTSNCNEHIPFEILSKIKELYYDPTLPDLSLEKASAIKFGNYLNFNVNMINKGLALSPKTNLTIYVNGKKFSTYEIGELGIGAGKSISVENAKSLASTFNISFVIDEENNIAEIDEQNNVKSLFLEG